MGPRGELIGWQKPVARSRELQIELLHIAAVRVGNAALHEGQAFATAAMFDQCTT